MILDAIFGQTRASLEDPSQPLNPDFTVGEMFGGETADSGVPVNADKALTYAAWWRGINLISLDTASLPLLIYRRTDDGKRRDPDHPAFRLIHRKANPSTTAKQFKQTLTGHAMSYGNGYAWIERTGSGRPIGLHVLDPKPNITFPVKLDGELWYVTNAKTPDGTSEPHRLRGRDVLHIRGLGFDGLTGYSVVDYAAQSIGLGIGARKYSAVFFKNAATGKVVLEHPAQLSTDAAGRLRNDWERIQTGLDNAHRTIVLTEGMTARAMNVSAKDSQLIELREFEVRDVANFLGIPPHMLGDRTRTSQASLEQENQSYLSRALNPWLHEWEAECTDKLTTDAEQRTDSHFAEFIREGLIQVTLETRSQVMINEVNNGLLLADEARAILNRPPYEGGDKPRIPANIVVFDPNAQTDADPVTPGVQRQDAERSEFVDVAHRALFRDAIHRVVDRVIGQCRRLNGIPEKFDDWLHNKMLDENEPFMRAAILPVMVAMRGEDCVDLAERISLGAIARIQQILIDEMTGEGSFGERLESAKVALIVKDVVPISMVYAEEVEEYATDAAE